MSGGVEEATKKGVKFPMFCGTDGEERFTAKLYSNNS